MAYSSITPTLLNIKYVEISMANANIFASCVLFLSVLLEPSVSFLILFFFME